VTCWSVGGHSERAEELVEAILRRWLSTTYGAPGYVTL
jgi:hypothetical protein